MLTFKFWNNLKAKEKSPNEVPISFLFRNIYE